MYPGKILHILTIHKNPSPRPQDDDPTEEIARLATEPRLQLPPSLKPSASENALTGGRGDETKISEKTIKPEILMDLSRLACDDTADEECRLFDEGLLIAGRPKRKLSRVSSDSACIPCPSPEVRFQVGDDDPPSLRHSQTDLTTCGLMDDEVAGMEAAAARSERLEAEAPEEGLEEVEGADGAAGRRWRR